MAELSQDGETGQIGQGDRWRQSFIIRTQSEYFLPPPLKFWGLENIQCIPAQSMQNILCFFSSILLSYVKLKATENVFKV